MPRAPSSRAPSKKYVPFVQKKCTICQEHITKPIEEEKLDCTFRHSFHKACIKQLFEHTPIKQCPLCREYVDPIYVKQLFQIKKDYWVQVLKSTPQYSEYWNRSDIDDIAYYLACIDKNRDCKIKNKYAHKIAKEISKLEQTPPSPLQPVSPLQTPTLSYPLSPVTPPQPVATPLLTPHQSSHSPALSTNPWWSRWSPWNRRGGTKKQRRKRRTRRRKAHSPSRTRKARI